VLQLLRIQSPNGTKRVEISSSDSTLRLYEVVRDAFDFPGFLFAIYKERGRKQEMISSRSRKLSTEGLSHGDLLYMENVNGGINHSTPSTSKSSEVSTPSTPSTPLGKLVGFQVGTYYAIRCASTSFLIKLEIEK